MGKATIISGGTDGNYTVKMDYGKAIRDARVTKISTRLAELEPEITKAQTALDVQKVGEDALKAATETSINDYVVATKAIAPAFADVRTASEAYLKALSSATATAVEKDAAKVSLTVAEASYKNAQDAVKPKMDAQVSAALKLIEEKKKTDPLRLKLDVLQDEKTHLDKDKAYQTGLKLEATLQAWCADFTEKATGIVATVEIPGENQVVLIAPGAPAHSAADGVLVAREAQSPEQVFFNAAILPGWQKFKPTYRRGVITTIDKTENTANVTFDDDKSSAQNLGINRYPSLEGIPVKYMTCHARVFEVGDKCVVKFKDGNWSFPTVVGFVDNPKRCSGRMWVLITKSDRENTSQGWITTATSKLYHLPHTLTVSTTIAPEYAGTTVTTFDRVGAGTASDTTTQTYSTGANLGALDQAHVYNGQVALTSRNSTLKSLNESYLETVNMSILVGGVRTDYTSPLNSSGTITGKRLLDRPMYAESGEFVWTVKAYENGGTLEYYKLVTPAVGPSYVMTDAKGVPAVRPLSYRPIRYTAREIGTYGITRQGGDFYVTGSGDMGDVYGSGVMSDPDLSHVPVSRSFSLVRTDSAKPLAYEFCNAKLFTPTGRVLDLSMLKDAIDVNDYTLQAGGSLTRDQKWRRNGGVSMDDHIITVSFIPDQQDLFLAAAPWGK